MDYLTELMRIADKVEDKADADIIRAAAVQLAPMPEPKFEDTTKVPGFGYTHTRLY